MIAVILAGGRGTRLSEETLLKPKPLVEAGGHPLIWHIMMNFSLHGINEFVVLVGYRGIQIREYFANFWMHQSDVTFNLQTPDLQVHNVRSSPWKVTVMDTGVDTPTGGRVSFLKEIVKSNFLLTYGDGVADVNITSLVRQHENSKNIATLTAVQPPARFGALIMKENQVENFQEKPEGDGAWVNGGFFVLSPRIFSFIENLHSSFELDVLPKIASAGMLGAFRHSGFWQPVDTIRDLQRLEEKIKSGVLPWIPN